MDDAAETALRGLDAAAVAALPLLLRNLARLSHHADGAAGGAVLTVRPLDGATAHRTPELRRLTEALVAARILSATHEGNTVYRLAHQRVLQSWRRAREALQADSEFFRIRDDVEDAQRRWSAAGRRPELLLAKGLPLEEAESIASRYREELSADTLDFIATSGHRARRG